MYENYDAAVLEEVVALKRKAVERTGFDDFGDPLFEGALTAWVHDLINGDLNDFGRQFLRRIALSDLCRRLKVMEYLAEHPEISEVEIPPTILIMAAPRTGTTLLHNLNGDTPPCPHIFALGIDGAQYHRQHQRPTQRTRVSRSCKRQSNRCADHCSSRCTGSTPTNPRRTPGASLTALDSSDDRSIQ